MAFRCDVPALVLLSSVKRLPALNAINDCRAAEQHIIVCMLAAALCKLSRLSMHEKSLAKQCTCTIIVCTVEGHVCIGTLLGNHSDASSGYPMGLLVWFQPALVCCLIVAVLCCRSIQVRCCS